MKMTVGGSTGATVNAGSYESIKADTSCSIEFEIESMENMQEEYANAKKLVDSLLKTDLKNKLKIARDSKKEFKSGAY